MQDALLVLAAVALAGWLGVALGTARAWDLRPIVEDGPIPAEPRRWPRVAVLVPARNEATLLPRTLAALLAQDYPGEWRVVLVDDRSSDATGRTARDLGVEVVDGAALPEGWVGKVWALQQAAVRVHETAPEYYLLTDADIRHAPHSLRRIVAESEAGSLALCSRMARLRCRSRGERLLIPPFLLFFNLLYPMRRVNDPTRRAASAAGGCVLVRCESLERAGGFEAIADRVIDDVSLAQAVKRLGQPIRLAVSRSEVASLREHDLPGIWRMVRRTAFTQLRHSWSLLLLTLLLLVLLFVVPPVLTSVAIGAAAAGVSGAVPVIAVSATAWALMTFLYLPTVRYFDLGAVRALTLPIAGCLYGGMTLDSAFRRRHGAW